MGEKMIKAQKTKEQSKAQKKKIEQGASLEKTLADEKSEKAEMIKNSEKRGAVLQAKAALSADNLRREEMSAAFAMKVKVLKIKSKQLEDRAKTDQRHAKERSDEAVAALARVRKLEESIKQKRQKAMTKILRANKRAIAKDKRAVRDAKQRAEKVGLRAEKKMAKSHKLEAKLARDQKEAGDIFKRATRAREMYKTAQKNTEKAAIRSSKANKAFAKEKYDLAMGAMDKPKLSKSGKEEMPKSNGMLGENGCQGERCGRFRTRKGQDGRDAGEE